MKDYLKCSLTDDEKKLIKAIIWITALDYKKNNYKRNKRFMTIDNIELPVEDEYDFVRTENKGEICIVSVLSQMDKERIVEYIDSVLTELSLNKFRIALTFDEKLVLFLCSFRKYPEKDAANLLNVKLRRIKYLKESIKVKKGRILGGINNV